MISSFVNERTELKCVLRITPKTWDQPAQPAVSPREPVSPGNIIFSNVSHMHSTLVIIIAHTRLLVIPAFYWYCLRHCYDYSVTLQNYRLITVLYREQVQPVGRTVGLCCCTG